MEKADHPSRTSAACSAALASVVVFAALWISAPPLAAEEQALDTLVARAVLDYAERLQSATKELATTRVTIANERTPLMDQIRATEEEISRLEADLARLQVERARAEEKAQLARADQVTLDRNLGYVANIVLDGFKSYEGNLLPGEAAALGSESGLVKQRIEQSQHPDDALAALDATEIFLARLRRQLGGYTTPGSSLRDGDNLVLKGTFAYLGPDVFFRSDNGEIFGTVRERQDSPHVVTHVLKNWDAAQAQALVRGEKTEVPADSSGGKALRLLDTKGGGWWAEAQKGGIVGYVIMALGVVAIVLVGMKLVDLQQLAVDPPSVIHNVTSAVARGSRAEVEAMLPKLHRTTRDLVATGLRHMDGPRALLEEHFEGFVLRHRLQQERRLPLLAVIATAGPLLGLLGTVTGMIKTFTLITVFGTGSAGRLSGGISEALVATALGLAVAIPTLVVHGFLSHRIHKGLGLLERYSLEFVTAVEEARAGRKPPPGSGPSA